MLSPILQSPPPTAPQAHTPVHIIAVRIKLPAALPSVPAGNVIGSHILSVAFATALRAHGLLVSDCLVRAGELNDSFFAMSVTQARPALVCLESVLTETNLRTLATLLMHHPGEICFVPWGPDYADVGCTFTLDQLRAALQREKENSGSLIAFLTDLKAMSEKPATPPPADPEP